MKIESVKDILEIIKMPEKEFFSDIAPEAKRVAEKSLNRSLYVSSMLGYSNVCKNQCLYCGMRAGNTAVKRFRFSPEEVIRSCYEAADCGFMRVFLVSGEDPKYGFENLLKIVSSLKQKGIFVSLACGELEFSQYDELRAAGTEEYVLKFEMSNPESFNRLNPSTTFDKRIKCIEYIKNSGLRLASGNIIHWPGQSDEELAEDIALMKKLEISWAPVIPYMPAANTPLAAEGVRGDLLKLYKEISILRLIMPTVNITAQQPGEDIRKGLADVDANAAAIDCGANVLFCDLLPSAEAKNFRVIDDRNFVGAEHIYKLAEKTGYALDSGMKKR